MILIFRPFKVGDFIDTAGAAGPVKEIGIGYSSSISDAYDTINQIMKDESRIIAWGLSSMTTLKSF